MAAIRAVLPDANYYYLGDVANCPYGTKTPAELLAITTKVVAKLQAWGAELIVIACNTATTRCIQPLRQRFPELTFVGTEPAVKLARQQGALRPLLLSTPATATSPSLQRLIKQHYPGTTDITSATDSADLTSLVASSTHAASTLAASTAVPLTVMPCPGLADTIEHALAVPHELILSPGDPLPALSISPERLPDIRRLLDQLFQPLQNLTAFDSVILGCTHYVILQRLLQRYFPKARLLDGNAGVAQRVKSLFL